MWPSMFGPGWGWGAGIALAFLCLALGVLGFLLLIINKPPGDTDGSSERLWHRFEEGDITRAEFERLRRANQSQLGARGIGE